jgi:hypothetical protein
MCITESEKVEHTGIAMSINQPKLIFIQLMHFEDTRQKNSSNIGMYCNKIFNRASRHFDAYKFSYKYPKIRKKSENMKSNAIHTHLLQQGTCF